MTPADAPGNGADGAPTDAAIDAALAARGLVPSGPARAAIRAGARQLAASVARLHAAMADADVTDDG